MKKPLKKPLKMALEKALEKMGKEGALKKDGKGLNGVHSFLLHEAAFCRFILALSLHRTCVNEFACQSWVSEVQAMLPSGCSLL